MGAATLCGPRRAAPKQAAAIASDPPEVNTTDLGLAPTAAATRSRAHSSRARASVPSVWMRPGSPSGPVQASRSAARASGRRGWVEAPSRYARVVEVPMGGESYGHFVV